MTYVPAAVMVAVLPSAFTPLPSAVMEFPFSTIADALAASHPMSSSSLSYSVDTEETYWVSDPEAALPDTVSVVPPDTDAVPAAPSADVHPAARERERRAGRTTVISFFPGMSFA